MQCDACSRLMSEALDGELAMDVRAHLETCSDCLMEWQSLSRVDTMLRAAPMLEPPSDFALNVMASVGRDAERLPEWRRSLAQIGMISTGTLGAAWLIVSLSAYWQLADLVPGLLDLGAGTATGLVLAARALSEASLSPSIAVPLYAGAAALMAFVWFGATILPRHAWSSIKSPSGHIG